MEPDLKIESPNYTSYQNNLPKFLLFDFNPINPLGFEWAHILSKSNNLLTYIYNDDFDQIRPTQTLSQIPWSSFRTKHINQEIILFLPWFPRRIYFIKLIFFWLLNRFPRIIWIDHNFGQTRDNSGLVLFFLRKFKSKRFIRTIHSSYSGNLSLGGLLHPIFFNYVEYLKPLLNKNFDLRSAQIILFGRINSQKGIDMIPEITERLAESMRSINKVIKIIIVGTSRMYLDPILAEIDALDCPFVVVERKISSSPISELDLAAQIYESNLVIAPYRELTASATVSLAIAFDKPVILMGETYPDGIDSAKIKEFIFLAQNSITKFTNLIVNNLQFDQQIDPAQKIAIESSCLDSLLACLK